VAVSLIALGEDNMKAHKIVMAVMLLTAGSVPAFGAGNLAIGNNGVITGLIGISGALRVPPGIVPTLVATLVPIGQDALAGGLNAVAELPGLQGLGGQQGSSDPLLGIQAIPAVGSNAAVAINELPIFVPAVIKYTVPSVFADLLSNQ
jgi:hypothetical protein